MKSYTELLTAVLEANPILSRSDAHDYLRRLPEGRAAYARHLQAKGIMSRETMSATVASTPKASPGYATEYLRLVACVREADVTLSATAAHRTVMRDTAGREEYRRHLERLGVIRRGQQL